MAEIKFRPYLTTSELDVVITSLRKTNSSPILIHYLSGFRDKITVGLVSPNLITKPTLTDRLELSGSPKLAIDLVQSKQQAYEKWLVSSHTCSIQELARAQMYRYENDLMDDEEESDYESKIDKGY